MAYELSLSSGMNGQMEMFLRIYSAQTSANEESLGPHGWQYCSRCQLSLGLEWEKKGNGAHWGEEMGST